MKSKLFIVALFMFMLPACSSIVSKADYGVAINSQPGGANFVVTNRAGQKVHSGVTPSSVTLQSSAGYLQGEKYTISFEKSGYSKQHFTLRSSVDGWYWGNLLFGGVLGMLIVDPITGAMFNLPARVDVSMDAQEVSEDGAQDLTIRTIDSLSSEELSRLEAIHK